MDAAGVEVLEDMIFAIWSEDPHNSLACMALQDLLTGAPGRVKLCLAQSGVPFRH